jgi:hypothetical protein
MPTWLEDGLWDLVSVVAVVGIIGGTIYYTYWGGWLGFFQAAASGLLGLMMISYFGHMMPFVGHWFHKKTEIDK